MFDVNKYSRVGKNVESVMKRNPETFRSKMKIEKKDGME